MWCQQCRQHVSTAADDADGGPRCAVGLSPLLDAPRAPPLAQRKPARRAIRRRRRAEIAAPSPASAARPWTDGEFWAFDQELADIAQRIALYRLPAAPSPTAADDAHEGAAPESVNATGEDGHTEGGGLVGALATAVTGLGLMATSCGAALVAWSQFSGRHELWRIGLPAGAAGLLALIVGWLLRPVASATPAAVPQTNRWPTPNASARAELAGGTRIDRDPTAKAIGLLDEPWSDVGELFADVDAAIADARAAPRASAPAATSA
jgi:hypothetical protein